MAIITKNELKNLTSNIGFSERSSYLSKAVNLAEAKSRKQTTIFLSHSHTDKDVIEPAILFLKSLGVNVYVDWKDGSMPPITDGETAAKLKTKIQLHDRFILLASPNALKSNWVNWELGYGDAHKYISNIAIFPTVENAGDWKDAEYLQIYPRIERSREYLGNFYEDVFHVISPDGIKVSLKKWLER